MSSVLLDDARDLTVTNCLTNCLLRCWSRF